ncbi:MAG: hypothetical protein R3C97_15995 [Geminicoccaceae bacterium]
MTVIRQKTFSRATAFAAIAAALTFSLSACMTDKDLYGKGPIELSPGAAQHFEKYSQVRNPGAFAVTPDGRGAYYTACDGSHCLGGNLQKLVQDCSRHYGQSCQVYAVGRGVVWQEDVVPAAGPEN